jgi:hypothetical protein
MKDRAQFAAMGFAVLAGVAVVLFAGGPPAQGEKRSIAAALNLPFATATTMPEPTPVPEPEQDASGVPNRGLVRLSHYWPPLGGVNCARFVNGQCVSNMSSGEPWAEWVDVACACPEPWPFGTTITLVELGRTFICMDRGGKIKFVDGIPWLDTLTEEPLAPYGSIHLADVRFPE